MIHLQIPLPPEPKAGEKLERPASYFPSIEKTYGNPMRHWLDITGARLATQGHMEAMGTLKAGHGLGHGHANAIVAYVKGHLGT